MKTAFSTVACPDWTLAEVADFAAETGFDGVELRTFGHNDTTMLCEPCLTGQKKVRDLFEDAGVEPAALATSIRYDAPVFPPIAGRIIGDFNKPVRETKNMVEVATSIEAPYVRVFAFELPKGESRKSGLRRIMERIDLALTTARHTGTRLLLENGGSFPLAEDLAEIIERANNPLIAAAYSPAVAYMAGEDPAQGVKLLGRSLASIKLRDRRDGTPVALGSGEIPNEAAVRAAAERGYDGWLTIEWDRIWMPMLESPREVLPKSLATLYAWTGREQTERERRKFAARA
ncbi:MAG: TIM barrel protein [Planctomycetota bacterium]